MSKSNLIPLPSDVDLTSPEGVNILNDRLRRLSQASGTGNTIVKAAIRGSSGTGTGTGGGTGGGTAPADVTIISTTPVYRSLPDAYGNILLDALIEYTVPPAWTGDGVHGYDEFPDQSAGLVMQLASSAIGGGPAPGIGDAILAGEWAPSDEGKTPYDATAAHHYAIIQNLVAPTKPTDLRVYLVGYSAGIDPKVMRAGLTGASPTFVVTVQSPLVLGGAPPIPDLTNFTAVAGAPYDRGDGKLIQSVHFTFDPPTDPQIAGVWFEAIWDDPSIPPDRHTTPIIGLNSGEYNIRLDTTIVLHNVVIYARTYDSNGNINPISASTPFAIIQIGSLAGTLDLTRILLSKVAAYFVIQGNLFGVANQGITNQLIADLTITAQQLAAAAVTAPKVAALAIGTANIQAAAITTALIQTAAITNALIQNAAITDAKIADLSANKITAGTISAIILAASTITGTTLSLILNGLTTVLSNVSTAGSFAALKTTNGTSEAYVCPDNITTHVIGGNASIMNPGSMNCDSAGHSVHLDGANGWLRIDGNVVMGARIAGPGAPSFSSFADVQTFCAAIRNVMLSQGFMF